MCNVLQVVVGPTNQAQDSISDRTTTPEVIVALKNHARMVLGDAFMEGARVAGTYAGIRPATEFRDYQVGLLVCYLVGWLLDGFVALQVVG